MRWTASQLSSRYIAHLFVVLMLLALTNPTNIEYPSPLSNVYAVDAWAQYSPAPTPTVLPTPVPVDQQATPLASPTPLPTPVPVDADATPLAAPPITTPAPRAQTAVAPPAAQPPPAAASGMAWPIAGNISQYFSILHLALDVAAPYGTPVGAAQQGIVTFAGWRNNGGGWVVEIDHGDGLVSGYNHLSDIFVAVGQQVAQGEAIAAVGCTGLCTGPHLHFTLSLNGRFVDPLAYL